MAITSDYLLAGVKRRITDPQHQNRLKNEDILAFADQIVQAEIIPIMESAQQDFFITQSTIPIVTGQSEYNIPYRSIGRNIRELKIKTTGTDFNTTTWRNVPLISIENAYIYYSWSNIAGFYFHGDKIRLVPDITTQYVGTELVIWWRLPPNKLVEFDQVSQVVSIAGATVTVDGVPGDMSDPNTPVDFIQAASGNSIISYDVPIQSSGTTEITFYDSSDIPSSLVPGDYICNAGQSYVLNFVPNECYPLVETLTAKRCAQAIADYDNLKILEEDAKSERKNFQKLIEPRIDGEPTVIINPRSITRSMRQNQRTWLYGQ